MENKGYPCNWTEVCHKKMLNSQERVFSHVTVMASAALQRWWRTTWCFRPEVSSKLDPELVSLPFTYHWFVHLRLSHAGGLRGLLLLPSSENDIIRVSLISKLHLLDLWITVVYESLQWSLLRQIGRIFCCLPWHILLSTQLIYLYTICIYLPFFSLEQSLAARNTSTAM